MEPPALLGERQRAELLPHREPIEGHLRLEREQRAQRAAVDLGEHPPARGGRLVEKGEVLSPDVGHAAPGEDAEGDRSPGLDREIAQAGVILAQPRIARRPVDAFAGDLEQTGVQVTHHADQPAHFVPRRQTASDRLTARSLVSRRA